VVVGFLLAPAVASLAMAFAMPAYDGLPSFAERVWKTAQIYAVLGAYPITLMLGLPFYFMLRRHFAPTLLNCAVAGAAVAAIPLSFLILLPTGMSQESVGGYATVIDGRRTGYGWLLGGESVLEIAAFGLIGGLVFWLVVVASRGKGTSARGPESERL
jgi:hypothetical protein